MMKLRKILLRLVDLISGGAITAANDRAAGWKRAYDGAESRIDAMRGYVDRIQNNRVMICADSLVTDRLIRDMLVCIELDGVSKPRPAWCLDDDMYRSMMRYLVERGLVEGVRGGKAGGMSYRITDFGRQHLTREKRREFHILSDHPDHSEGE